MHSHNVHMLYTQCVSAPLADHYEVFAYEKTGAQQTEQGIGPICNCICLKLQKKVRVMTLTAFWDVRVGEMSKSGLHTVKRPFKFTVSPVIFACLSSSWCPAISLG